MPIFRHRNNGGYSLVDAAVSLFIASVVLLAVFGLMSAVVRSSGKTVYSIDTILQDRNEKAEAVLSLEK